MISRSLYGIFLNPSISFDVASNPDSEFTFSIIVSDERIRVITKK
jgi:hypothetical protein